MDLDLETMEETGRRRLAAFPDPMLAIGLLKQLGNFLL